jgi:hypothetical protein
VAVGATVVSTVGMSSSASKWQVPRRRYRTPAPEYLLLEEEEDGGLDRFFKFSPSSFVLILWTPV